MSKNPITIKCEVRDGWGYVTFSKRGAMETMELIRDCIHEQSKYGFGMAAIHRLSRMWMELDRTTGLEMLSREDLLALTKCIPTVIENVTNTFYRSNFFKSDNNRFKEANLMCKTMFEIHES